MKVIRSTRDTVAGPADWFSGTVLIDPITEPDGGLGFSAASVRFLPGARTAWHTHPKGQTIWVTDGVGLCQRQGGPVQVIRPGDAVCFVPGENHWHGAAATRFMTHIAIQETDDDGQAVSWGTHVTDEEYSRSPSIGE